MQKAVFYDRDGIILQMVYDPNQGIIYTPRRKEEVKLQHGIKELLAHTKSKGYKNIVVSNQPDIGLGRLTLSNFSHITDYMHTLLEKDLLPDAEYYCFHHPFAEVELYKKDCLCHKPKPGMLLDAAREHAIDLKKSFIIGDSAFDVLAGQAAGCKTILLGKALEAEYLSIIQNHLGEIKPDYIVRSLPEVLEIL